MFEIDNLYTNAIHMTTESILSYYMPKERERELRQHYVVIDNAKNILYEKNQRLKVWVEEVESTMK